MTMKTFIMGFFSKTDNSKEEKVSIDVYYQEKYNEMRRHHDNQFITANWCTIILLAIIGGFISLKNDNSRVVFQYCFCAKLLFMFLVIFFILAIVFLAWKIVDHSAKRYAHLRDWVSENIEPTINGKKYKPDNFDVPIQNVIKSILLFLGFLTTFIVIIYYFVF